MDGVQIKTNKILKKVVLFYGVLIKNYV